MLRKILLLEFLDALCVEKQTDGLLQSKFSTGIVSLFHGNAENVAQSAARMGQPIRQALDADVFVAEYRGFGKSEGWPTATGLLQDATAAMDWVCQRTGKEPGDIIVVGHSLGGGPACHVAATCGCQTLILDRTYDSLAAAAQWNYPIFPIKLLMRNDFPSDQWIKNYQGPVFISHGDQDTLIPVECAQRLFDAAPCKKKELMIVPKWGHWGRFPANYWRDVERFCFQ